MNGWNVSKEHLLKPPSKTAPFHLDIPWGKSLKITHGMSFSVTNSTESIEPDESPHGAHLFPLG